jgi:aldehyde dehydrogenase (NAD+)
VLVHKNVAKSLVVALKKTLKELIPEDFEKSPHYSRISCRRHFDRLKKMFKEQILVEGTKLECGGSFDENIRYIEPAILTGLTLERGVHPMMNEEIFGPFLPVIEVSSIKEAIEYVNASS